MRKNLLKNIIFFAAICLFIISNVSCFYTTDNIFYSGNDVDLRIGSLKTITDFIDNPESLPDKYNILILTDLHFGKEDTIQKENELFTWLDRLYSTSPENYPEFCVSLGDVVDHGSRDEYEIYRKFVNRLENNGPKSLKVINILGNHDLFHSGWNLFKEYCYPHCSFFRFYTKEFTWYALDTGTGIVGQKQFYMLKEALGKDSRPKIILMHYPLFCNNHNGILGFHDSTERNFLIDLFAGNNVKVVFTGHLHKTVQADMIKFTEYSTTSFFKEPGWALFEIDEKNLSVTNIPVVK